MISKRIGLQVNTNRAKFERTVIAYALNELSLADFENWTYENADEVILVVGLDTWIALLGGGFFVGQECGGRAEPEV